MNHSSLKRREPVLCSVYLSFNMYVCMLTVERGWFLLLMYRMCVCVCVLCEQISFYRKYFKQFQLIFFFTQWELWEFRLKWNAPKLLLKVTCAVSDNSWSDG